MQRNWESSLDLPKGGISAIRKVFLCLILAIPVLAQEIVFPPVQKYFSIPTFTEEKKGFSISLYQANIFEAKSTYHLDFAETRLTFYYSGIIKKNFGFQIYIPFFYAWGGLMDPFIDKFHRAFNFPDAGRGNYEYGRIAYWINGKIYLNSRSFTGIGEPHLFLSFRKGPIILRLGFKIPLKDNGFNSGKTGTYAGLSLKTRRKNLTFGLEAGAVIIPNSEEVKSLFYTLNASIKYRWIKVGFLSNTSPYREGDLSHPANAVFVQFLTGGGFSIGIVEDLSPYDTSADFTIFVSKKIKI